MDFVHLGSALSLRSKNFLGSAFTVFGTSRFGCETRGHETRGHNVSCSGRL